MYIYIYIYIYKSICIYNKIYVNIFPFVGHCSRMIKLNLKVYDLINWLKKNLNHIDCLTSGEEY